MKRTIWILGNWKQNHLRSDASACASELFAKTRELRAQYADLKIGVAPTYVALDVVRPNCDGSENPLLLLAQDAATQDDGAFTGEVGPKMLIDAGVDLAIIGHSERRALYGDTDGVVAQKVAACAAAGIGIVLCIGEKLESRDAGSHESVVLEQLKTALDAFPKDAQSPLVLAYEPVWAIGTGRTASPEQASSMHRCIRAYLRERDGDRGHGRSILYGGSVKPENAAELMAAGDIDGFLVGGASLKAESLTQIALAAAQNL